MRTKYINEHCYVRYIYHHSLELASSLDTADLIGSLNNFSEEKCCGFMRENDERDYKKKMASEKKYKCSKNYKLYEGTHICERSIDW